MCSPGSPGEGVRDGSFIVRQYQWKATDIDDIPYQGDLLEELETNDQAFVVFPVSDVSISQYQLKECDMVNIPRQSCLLEVSETGDQVFEVVPTSDVSMSQEI